VEQYGPLMVCQGNFVDQIDFVIKDLIADKQDDYTVGFIDGLIKAIQIIRNN